MTELVKYIVLQFAEKKDEVEFLEEEVDNVVTITVVLNEDDMGKVIGRQGKIAKAMRTIVKSAAAKSGKKYNVEIKERGEM
ncbi:MAG: KH domain-containing protein [Clostridia bacterium]|nr:KH domain-containing protein [Clostridia bacterium]